MGDADVVVRGAGTIGLLETVTCLALPGKALARPRIARAVEARRGALPDPPPGPDREQLVALLGG